MFPCPNHRFPRKGFLQIRPWEDREGSQRLVQKDKAAGSVGMAPAGSEHPTPRRLPARESPSTPAHSFGSIITSMETGKLGRVCPPLASQDRATGSTGPRPGQRKSWSFLHLTQEPPCLRKVSKPPAHVPSWSWGGSVGYSLSGTSFMFSPCCWPGLAFVIRALGTESPCPTPNRVSQRFLSLP